MGAVLVGTAGDKKLYYVVDSRDPSKDGIVEDSDGSTHEVSFFFLYRKNNKHTTIEGYRVP